MNIQILQLLEGARQATGLTVIIDVFRAFSTACYVVGNGAKRMIPVGNLELAYMLKKQLPASFLIGERGGERPPDFDYGNSPADIEHVDFSGCTVIHTTSAGTQGIANATQADEILAGSFCNAGAIIRYIQRQQPEHTSLVCMGQAALESTDEDTLCAQYIKALLEGKPLDFERMRTHLRGYRSARKFFDPTLTWAPERDFELCLSLNRFDFVLKVQPNADGYSELCKCDV
jgi:2-phosphosulfolactate phosphatase